MDREIKECIVKIRYGMEIGYGQEIVRCKDCKYLINHHGFMDDGYCEKMREDYNAKFKPKRDWFCADGEKAVK